MPNRTILAVAIGNATHYRFTDPTDPNLNNARQYINGLVTSLKAANIMLGTGANQYVIDYYECTESKLATTITGNPDLIFCMSTTVMRQAVAFAAAQGTPMPVVGVVSDPKGEGWTVLPYTSYVCGVKANRFQLARECYDYFLQTVPDLTTVYALYKTGYPPSANALWNINNTRPVPAVAPNGTDPRFDLTQVTDAQLLINISNLNLTGTYNNAGIFVLPIDRCFGLAQSIINAAQNANIPTFWPVTDWVNTNNSSALGGFGVSQETCGEKMGKQIGHIFKNSNAVPTGIKQFLHFAPKDMTWLASGQAAQAIGITLPDDVPLASPPTTDFFE
jgi:hypothetical protein